MDFDPLRFPSQGVTSNFENPDFLGVPVLVTAGICLPLVLSFAALRIYARLAVEKSWKPVDYVFCMSCCAGVAFIAFAIPFILGKPNGQHAWDVQRGDIAKGALLNRQAFSVALGPVFWLLKLSLFGCLLTAFGETRWLKNCSYLGMVISGLVFAAYTIVFTMTCGPRNGSDTYAYLKGLNRSDCSSQGGLSATISIVMIAFNAACNLYLLVLPFPLVPKLVLTVERHGIYLIQLTGAFACICNLMAIFYCVKSWRSKDITGSRIPFIVAVLLEIAISLIIICMPSLYTIWRHINYPDISDLTPRSTPNMCLISSISTIHPSMSPPPPTESRSTWRKTHRSIDEIPYRKASSEYSRQHRSPYDPRMKALPTTPLPVTLPSSPTSPLPVELPLMPAESSFMPVELPSSPVQLLASPTSVRSMQLPIMIGAWPRGA